MRCSLLHWRVWRLEVWDSERTNNSVILLWCLRFDSFMVALIWLDSSFFYGYAYVYVVLLY